MDEIVSHIGGDTLDRRVEQRAYQVIGAAIEVHRLLGAGYLESFYDEALAHELTLRNVPFEAQYPIQVQYKDKRVGEGRLDLFVDQCLVVELKAVEEIHPIHKAQIMSYLRTTKCQLGLLINFNVMVLKQGGIKRIIYRSL